VEPLLAELGVGSEALAGVTGARFEGVWSAWAGPERFEPFGSDEQGPWQGFQVRRAAFEQLLLDEAARAGADVRLGQSPGDPILDGDRVTGAGGIGARITLDATGSARWLGRKLGLPVIAKSPVLLARCGYATGDLPDRHDAPLIRGDSEGWTWIARIDERLFQWVRLDFDGRIRPRDWKPDAVADLLEARPTIGAEVAWRRAVRTAGPGWMLAGDAAASLDPASSHGVLKALMSGVFAARTIEAVLRRGAPEPQAARAYHDWLAGWFDTDVERLAAAYRSLGAEGFG
jgi:flavin-dependent dehydrogenase